MENISSSRLQRQLQRSVEKELNNFFASPYWEALFTENEFETTLTKKQLQEEIDHIAQVTVFSLERKIKIMKEKYPVDKIQKLPTVMDIRKMKIEEVKELCKQHNIPVTTSSGAKGNKIKRDYVDAALSFLGNTIEDSSDDYRFYSHRKGKKGWMFSNFSDHPIRYRKLDWPTSEHLFQAMKFYPHDKKWFRSINTAKTPSIAKKMGNNRTHKIAENWEEVKVSIMKKILRIKIKTHPEIKKELISSNPKRIVEASPDDYYWGEGKDGSGKNMLGKLLMEIREGYI
jgi:N-glycosidase YbiA